MSKRRFTTEQDKVILDRYLAGESSEAIARDILLGERVDGVTIRNTLRRLGVEVRKAAHEMNPVVTDEQRERALVMCRDEGYKLQEAADALGISKKTVSNVVRDAGICRPGGKPRTCTVNGAAFDVLTPESLYWIGFLWADGNVHQDVITESRKSRATAGAPAITVGLSAVDREHLEKFRAFLGSTHAITENAPRSAAPAFEGGPRINTGPTVYFSIRSKGLCAALELYGFTTKRLRVPVPEVAKSRDFWRGMVDGDGSLGVYPIGGMNYPGVRLAGQRSLVEVFADFLKNNGLASLRPFEGIGVWTVSTTGNTATEIIHHLYANASVVLDRKRERAEMILRQFHVR